MHYLYSYFIENFILLCIITVMTINCIQKRNEHRRDSIIILFIMASLLVLSIFDTVKDYIIDNDISLLACTIITSVSYMLRCLCVFLFIIISRDNKKKSKTIYLLCIPLLLTVIIYLFPFFKPTSRLVFYYDYLSPGKLGWVSGTTILRYTAHIVFAFYLGYIVFKSFQSIRARHLTRALNIFTCGMVVVIAVLIETFLNDSGEIRILNTSIAVSVVFYYLYLYTERTKYDPLTNLFNRSMYYIDLPRMDNDITAIIMVDMNGLKYVNDNFGHIEGDKCLTEIANALKSSSTKKMYVYRLGGDEFAVLVNKESEETVINMINSVKEKLKDTRTHCSIGYEYRKNKNISIYELIKISEKKMYEDKAEFYKTASFDRRKTDRIE